MNWAVPPGFSPPSHPALWDVKLIVIGPETLPPLPWSEIWAVPCPEQGEDDGVDSMVYVPVPFQVLCPSAGPAERTATTTTPAVPSRPARNHSDEGVQKCRRCTRDIHGRFGGDQGKNVSMRVWGGVRGRSSRQGRPFTGPPREGIGEKFDSSALMARPLVVNGGPWNMHRGKNRDTAAGGLAKGSVLHLTEGHRSKEGILAGRGRKAKVHGDDEAGGRHGYRKVGFGPQEAEGGRSGEVDGLAGEIPGHED